MNHSTDTWIVAFADGELASEERAALQLLIDRSSQAREEVLRLTRSAVLIGWAFDRSLRDPVPERLVATVLSWNDHAWRGVGAFQRRTRHGVDRLWQRFGRLRSVEAKRPPDDGSRPRASEAPPRDRQSLKVTLP